MKKVTKIMPNTTAPSEKPKLRVAAYCRVSTDTDGQLDSLETQIKHYESFIRANPEWEYAGIYYDEGISGTKTEKRRELLRMIADCENGNIDLIVTKLCPKHNGLPGAGAKAAEPRYFHFLREGEHQHRGNGKRTHALNPKWTGRK